jgi:ATP-dependent 26S proteasome regulatory subunit
MIDTLVDLDVLLNSRYQFIYIESLEEARIIEHFRMLSKEKKFTVLYWSAADGLVDLSTKSKIWGSDEFSEALRYILKSDDIFVLVDVQKFLVNPINLRLLKEIARDPEHPMRTLVVIGSDLDLPSDVKRLGISYVPLLPDSEVVREIYYEEVYRYLSEVRGRRFVKPGDMEDKIVRDLAGLNEEDVRRLLSVSIRDDGKITVHDLKKILEFKRENSGKNGLVEFGIETLGLDNVGGLENLKEWLKLRKKTFLGEETRISIDPPKGLLLLGVQGSGKSLAAKAIAGTWHVPLMRLDFSNLYAKWVGESERNLKAALREAEAIAPCILWIDEIEKGVVGDSSSDADGGLSRRILGTLLTWMSERKSRVFIVATANDVTHMPPELLRKGRFDEIFFVDLPSCEVRREIFSIHIGKRNLDPKFFNLDKLAKASEGYSGAEIEQCVIGGMYIALGEKETPETKHFLDELAQTRPLSIVMGEKIAALRVWAQGRTVPADKRRFQERFPN